MKQLIAVNFGFKLTQKKYKENTYSSIERETRCIFKVISVNIYCILFQCLNKDGVKIVLIVTYQYKVRSDKLKDIILEFRDKDGYTKMLRYEGNMYQL